MAELYGGMAKDPVRNPIISTGADSIEAPKNIITKPQAARTIYMTYRTQSLNRIYLYASLEGLRSGNPPYDPADLAAHGLSHISNFNDLTARSLYEKQSQASWNLLNQSEYLVKFTLRAPKNVPVGDLAELAKYEEIMARNFSEVVREWQDFETMMNILTAQLGWMGLSPVVWTDERDWRFKTIDVSKLFVQDQCQTDIRQLTCVCVESIFPAQYLYSVYQNFKDKPKDESPWNMEELTRLLLQLANNMFKTPNPIVDMMDMQRRLENGDFTFDAIFTDGIPLISFFYKEYDEKITHYMFHPVTDFGDFLYMADRQYEEFSEGILIFTASPGEFTLHANRGLGHKIFSISQALMQLDCSIVDMARWASTLLLKGLATGTHQNGMPRLYPGTPTDIGQADYVRNDLGENLSQLVAASQYFNGKAQANTVNAGDDPSAPDASLGSVSPTQSKFKVLKEFGVLKQVIAHLYRQLDNLWSNVGVKMYKSKAGYPGNEYFEEWKDRCIDEGVPEIYFEYNENKLNRLNGLPRLIKSLKATRVAGDGSSVAMIMNLESLLPIAGDFGPREAAEYKRYWIIATFGPEFVPVFTQDDNSPDESAGGASLAGLENNDMKRGENPLFSPDNDHRAHFAVHMALAKMIIEAIQQGQLTPVDADPIFAVLVPHTGQHLEALSKSPFSKALFDQVKPLFDQVQNYATLNKKNAEAMIKAELEKREKDQEKTQEVMSDAERKDFQAVRDEQRKDAKQNATLERQEEASQTKGQIQRQGAYDKAANERLKITLEAQAKGQEGIEGTDTEALRERLDLMNGTTPAPADIEEV